MSRITGRSDDMLIIRGVNVFPSQVEEVILRMPRLAPTYQLVLSRDGHLDRMDVNVEMRPEAATDDPGAVACLATELQHHIKSYIGISTAVSVLKPDSIDRSAGKAKRVVDRRPKG